MPCEPDGTVNTACMPIVLIASAIVFKNFSRFPKKDEAKILLLPFGRICMLIIKILKKSSAKIFMVIFAIIVIIVNVERG